MRTLWQHLNLPPRFRPYFSQLRGKKFRMLDIGCQYHCPAITKRYFPQCEYHTIDRVLVEIDENDRRLMDSFYELDLNESNLSEVPEAHFDLVLCSHVIEHLEDGLSVVDRLAGKVRPGGLIYIEFPGPRSLSLPHRGSGCLHFCDDYTHRHVHTAVEVANILLKRRFFIEKAGRRRDWLRTCLTPALAVKTLLEGRPLGREFWDLLGFAEFVFARRPDTSSKVNLDRSG